MKSFVYIRWVLYATSAVLLGEAVCLYTNALPPIAYQILSVCIFAASAAYIYWFFVWSKPYATFYERIAEGALIAAVVFNPLILFTLDVGVWIFLDIVFGWVFFIYTFEVSDLKRKYDFDLPVKRAVEHTTKHT